MIARDRPDLSLSRQCEILAIGRSSFYYTPMGESPANLALMRRIDELFLKYPFYGSRQMARQLRRDGVRVGRHRVRRLMRLMGLAAISWTVLSPRSASSATLALKSAVNRRRVVIFVSLRQSVEYTLTTCPISWDHLTWQHDQALEYTLTSLPNCPTRWDHLK